MYVANKGLAMDERSGGDQTREHLHHFAVSEAWVVRLSLLMSLAVLALTPGLALAGSPFATGSAQVQSQLVTILTPIAAVAVMVSGAMAWFGRLSWWWMVAVVIGTVLVFGGPQIVSWIRGLFGV
jgi:type IV secretion system protein VirB2